MTQFLIAIKESLTNIRDNDSNDKKYSDAYLNFKKRVKFPNNYLNEMYESNYMRHFYTEKEIKSLKSKWRE